jgi:hypothetical protein
MSQVSTELNSQYWEPVANGPVAQADISASPELGTLPTVGTIAASGAWNSPVLPASGFKEITVAATSSQAGSISVQLYVDKAGAIAQGAASSQALTAATPAVLNLASNPPFQAFKITISNTGGSAATVTNFACLLNAA